MFLIYFKETEHHIFHGLFIIHTLAASKTDRNNRNLPEHFPTLFIFPNAKFFKIFRVLRILWIKKCLHGTKKRRFPKSPRSCDQCDFCIAPHPFADEMCLINIKLSATCKIQKIIISKSHFCVKIRISF